MDIARLQALVPGITIKVQGLVTSTNAVLKQRVRSEEARHGDTLIALSQTAGRGRLGRSFSSPQGLYLSTVLEGGTIEEKMLYTPAAAVAVCEALEALNICQPGIKWVNDLFVDGKKVCGILGEMVENSVVMGIGLNLNTPQSAFDPKVQDVAGAVNTPVPAEDVAAGIINRLLHWAAHVNEPGLMSAYEQRMLLRGREICFEQDGQMKTARVLGVDAQGGLRIVTDQGEQVLRMGEVSLRSSTVAHP